MKSIFKYRLLSLVLTISLVLAYMPGTLAIANDFIMNEDFESYSTSTNLKKEGYIVWAGASVGSDGDNNYLRMYGTDPGTNAQTAIELPTQPDADKVIVSLEFMMPEDPNLYDAWIFGVLNDSDRNKAAANIQLSNGTLYDGASAESSEAIRTGLEEDKWYKAFLVVDLENDTYTLYSGGFKSETKNFQSTKTYSKTNIFFNVRVKSMETPLYVDNVKIFPVENEALETALYRANGILFDSIVGCENGQYSPTSYNMLKECYDTVTTAVENGSLSESQAEEYAVALNSAIEICISGRIDTSATDGVARYIRFDMPEDIVVGDEGCNRQLSATAYDKANQIVDSDFTWSIEKGLTGVTLNGNTLSVAGGVRGEVVLKAATGNIYDYCTVNLTDGIRVNSMNVEGANGHINITGSFVNKPFEEVTVSVAGDDIAVEDTLAIDSDGSFSWSKNVGSDKGFQFITIRLAGNDIVPYSMKVPFYGVGWQEAVITSFNSISLKEEIEELVTTYSEGLNLPLELYTANQSAYDDAIFGGIPYSGLSALAVVVENLECVLAFEQATSNNIRTVVESHKELLAENGFDAAIYDSLSDDEKFVFYASVMQLTFDSETDTVTYIADELNTILENIDNPSSGEETISKATELFFSDDFENYEIGSGVGGGGYIRWGGDKVLGDSNNLYMQMLREADSRARLALELETEPNADEVIVSWDFMMPEAPNKYNADVMGVLSDDGNRPSVYIHLENGVLYDGKSTSTNPVKSGLKQGKWYNAFLLVDLKNDQYTLYIDEFKSSTNNFQTAVQDVTDIFFNVEVYDYNVPLNFDNFDMSLVKHSNLAVALYTAKSIMRNSDIGYSVGQYPQTAYNMLENTYKTMYNASCNADMTADQSEIYAEALNDAIEKFKGNKIGAGTSDTESYILFDIPDALGVDSVTGYNGTLNADVYNSDNQKINKTIVWTLADNYAGVSIVGNRLKVEKEVRGDIVIRASVGGIYDEHKLKLTDCKTVESMDVDSRNGKISISGEMSAVPLELVKVKVDGSVDVEGTFTFDDKGKFNYSQNIDATLPYGSITVTVEGNDATFYRKEVPFYGVGWENAVLSEFNGASSVLDTGNKISRFYVGLELDSAEYNKYSHDYGTRIYNNGSDYASFTALKNAIENQQCLVAFYEATRTDVESVFSVHMDTLERNGFDKTKFGGLTIDQKTGIYASALAISVDPASSTVNYLVGELNELVKNASSSNIIEDPDDEQGGGSVGGGSLGGGGGSSGGGGGGGSSSKDNIYDIELVPGTGETSPNAPSGEEIPSQTAQFADAHLAPWANDALLFVREKGIMIGDGTNVRPTDVVTRGEFAKIIAVAFELAEKEGINPFKDSRNKWWETYAALVNAYGIMNGIETTTFGGEENITRQMMAVAIYRVLNVSGKDLYDRNEGVEFSDSDAIASYAKEAVEHLSRKGIMSGVGNGLFAPELPVRRAEVAQIIYNILINEQEKLVVQEEMEEISSEGE